METVLNLKNIDPRQQPIFLGEPLSLQRYDMLKYPVFYKLAQSQEGFFWRPAEVNLVKDRSDYKTLNDVERFVFDTNLRWQTCTDAFLSRGIDTLQQYITNPELEACCKVWSFFETNIHSRSYSHILKNVYSDESKFWNSILEDAEIQHRAQELKQAFDDLFKDDDVNIKTKIFNSLVSVNVTESLAFYVSFACSFWFGQRGVMEGNAKIIKLIERDERLHAAITSELLKIMKKNADEGFQDIYSEDKIIEAFRIGVENEKQWTDYLFQHGNLTGIVKDQFKLFAEYRANERLRVLGIKPIYDKQKNNPLGNWYENYLSGSKVQVAPQETELTAYRIGSRNSSYAKEDLEDFEL